MKNASSRSYHCLFFFVAHIKVRVYGHVYCQKLGSTDGGDHVSLFILRVRTKSEQKWAWTGADRANKSWAGTETYEKRGLET